MTEPAGSSPAPDVPGSAPGAVDPSKSLPSASARTAPAQSLPTESVPTESVPTESLPAEHGQEKDAGEVLPSRARSGHTFMAMIREAVLVVAIALTLSLLLKTFLIQTFYIPSESMENTLVKNDRVVVSKLTPGPFSLHRGDIVVFEDPGGWVQPKEHPQQGPLRSKLREGLIFVGLLPNDSKEHVIKRVIGLPGDTVECTARGKVTVNGVALEESYLKPGSNTCQNWSEGKIVVPADKLWVMGDNRNDSGDSRFRGPIPLDKVVGKAFVLVWPLDRAHMLRTPDTFDKVPDPS